MNHNRMNLDDISGIIAFDLAFTLMSTYALTEIISQLNSIINYDLPQNITYHDKLTFLIAVVLLFGIYKTTLLEVLIFEADVEGSEHLELLNILEESIHSDYIMDFDDMV